MSTLQPVPLIRDFLSISFFAEINTMKTRPSKLWDLCFMFLEFLILGSRRRKKTGKEKQEIFAERKYFFAEEKKNGKEKEENILKRRKSLDKEKRHCRGEGKV